MALLKKKWKSVELHIYVIYVMNNVELDIYILSRYVMSRQELQE